MAEDIQGLLEKIHSEGIMKAQTERDEIIEAAKKEAESILAEAKAQAADFTRKAAAEAEAGEKKAADAIRQAARDAVIALRADLLNRLNAVVRECAAEAMTPDTMKSILLEMAKAYGKDGDSLELLLPKKEAGRAEQYLKSELLAALHKDPVIHLTADFNSGLQFSFRNNEVFFDFSDEALAEILCKFVGPKLAAVIKG